MKPNLNKKIFIVDDDPFCLAMYEEHLHNLGFTAVTAFSSGKELLSNLYKNPDLIFLDYNLDDIKGIELLLQIKEFNPNIHIVVVSGQVDMDIAIQFLKNGAFDYIIKDENDMEKISLAIDKWLQAIEFAENVTDEFDSENQVKHLKAVIEAQEKIRREIALQLHDNVDKLLGVSRLYVESAYNDEENRLKLLLDSKTAINSAIVQIRKLSQSLQPKKIKEYNLEEDVPKLITSLMMLDKFTVLSNLNINGLKNVLSGQSHKNIFDTMQCMINVIIKYSNAKRVLLGLTLSNNELHLLLTDDGVGYDLNKDEKSLGFDEIYQKIYDLKAHYFINTEPGKGCRWNIHFPLNKA